MNANRNLKIALLILGVAAVIMLGIITAVVVTVVFL
jgi:hypothetical protein